MAKAMNGNVGKHDCYALACDMINEAIDRCCPLQAIAIEESILADRLWSTLNAGLTLAKDDLKSKTLGKALVAWHPNPKTKQKNLNPNRVLFTKEIDAHFADLDSWWKARNKTLHSMVKSIQGVAPEIPADEFRVYAEGIAVEGLRLVKIVSKWSKKQIYHATQRKNKKNA